MQEEDQAVYEMEVYHVIEYIKAAIGVVLDIKFDEIERKFNENKNRMKQQSNQNRSSASLWKDNAHYEISHPDQDGIFSPRAPDHDDIQKMRTERGLPASRTSQHHVAEPQSSHVRSSFDTNVPSCPEMYEKLI